MHATQLSSEYLRNFATKSNVSKWGYSNSHIYYVNVVEFVADSQIWGHNTIV